MFWDLVTSRGNRGASWPVAIAQLSRTASESFYWLHRAARPPVKAKRVPPRRRRTSLNLRCRRLDGANGPAAGRVTLPACAYQTPIPESISVVYPVTLPGALGARGGFRSVTLYARVTLSRTMVDHKAANCGKPSIHIKRCQPTFKRCSASFTYEISVASLSTGQRRLFHPPRSRSLLT